MIPHHIDPGALAFDRSHSHGHTAQRGATLELVGRQFSALSSRITGTAVSSVATRASVGAAEGDVPSGGDSLREMAFGADNVDLAGIVGG